MSSNSGLSGAGSGAKHPSTSSDKANRFLTNPKVLLCGVEKAHRSLVPVDKTFDPFVA